MLFAAVLASVPNNNVIDSVYAGVFGMTGPLDWIAGSQVTLRKTRHLDKIWLWNGRSRDRFKMEVTSVEAPDGRKWWSVAFEGREKGTEKWLCASLECVRTDGKGREVWGGKEWVPPRYRSEPFVALINVTFRGPIPRAE